MIKSIIITVVIIFLLLIVIIFGAYPKFLNLKDTKSILLETRNYNCMRKINSSKSKCPNIESYIDNQTEIQMLENAFNIVWCPFLPLSFGGSPYYEMNFKSNSDTEYILYIKGDEISLGCWLPSEAKKSLNEITTRLNLNSK